MRILLIGASETSGFGHRDSEAGFIALVGDRALIGGCFGICHREQDTELVADHLAVVVTRIATGLILPITFSVKTVWGTVFMGNGLEQVMREQHGAILPRLMDARLVFISATMLQRDVRERCDHLRERARRREQCRVRGRKYRDVSKSVL
jgi:hypothetical protein